MLSLSDNSIKNVMQIVKYQKDAKTISTFIRSCSRMNQVAIQNSFDKMKATNFELRLRRHNPPQVPRETQLLAYIGKHSAKYRRFEDDKLNRSRGLEDRGRAVVQDSDPEVKKYPVPPITNIHKLIERAFKEATQKVSSINELSFSELTLDSGILQICEQYANNFRAAKKVILYLCTIEWTAVELMKFLQLFEGLKDVWISGKFNKPILTDEHLSLVSEKITICSETGDTIVHFPGITSKICDHWLKNKIENISFYNITTEILFDDIQKLTKTLNETVHVKQHMPYWGENRLNFGVLKYSENEYRKVILAHRDRIVEWKFAKRIDLDYYLFKVYPENSCYSYEFRMERPYEEPDFPKLLDQLNKLRAEVEAVENDDFNLNKFYGFAMNLIGSILLAFKKKHNLPSVRAEDLNLEGDFRINADENLDPIQFRRQQRLIEINLYERVILYRMGQLEEPVPE